MTTPSDLPEMQSKRKELQDWRGTLAPHEDEHLKDSLEYVRYL